MHSFFQSPSLSLQRQIQQLKPDGVSPPVAEINHGRWLKRQHHAFLEGLQRYGKDWASITAEVRTRIVSQTRSHAQKYFNKLDLHASQVENNMSAIIGSPWDRILTRAQCHRPPTRSPSFKGKSHKSYSMQGGFEFYGVRHWRMLKKNDV